MSPEFTTAGEIVLQTFPTDGFFPAAGSWLRGVVRTDAASSVVDMRAQVAGETTYGFCDRSLTEVGANSDSSSVGFVIFLRPPAGRHWLKLEFYDAARGCWWENFRCEIESDAAVRKVDHVPATGPDAGWMLLQTLRQQHAQPRLSWRQHARAAWAAGAAGTTEIKPDAPLFGCLEEPGERVRVNHGLLSISGWVAHATYAISHVTAYVDPRLPARLDYGLPRADVAEAFGNLRGAARCQFAGEVVVPLSHPQPWGLVVCVELDNGEPLLAFARRVQGPSFAADLPGELPPYSAARFGSAAAAVLATRGWRGLGRAGREITLARKTYLRHASPFVALDQIRYQAPACASVSARPVSVVMVNDNFTLGGAALFAFEYARFLAQQPGCTVRLATPQDGPLRTLCAEAGISVEIVDMARLTPAMSEAEFHSHIGCIAAALDWRGADVVIVNTLVAYWAVPLARVLGKPVLFYIHESARIDALFPAARVPLVEAAIAGATRTVFVTEWTRSQHRSLEGEGNFRLLRSWTDIARLDAFSTAHDRTTLRRAQGLSSDAIVVVCLGSICDRKGQRLLIRAIEQLASASVTGETENPRALQFLLVGARPSPDVEQLRRDIAVRGLNGLVCLVDETPDALGFLWLADIYVCPSFEEGFPRALMEAAVFGLQIVATRICGIPEMLREQDAWLVPPGDPARLADALHQAMQAHRAGDLTRPRNARARMEKLFNAAAVLPEHAALVGETLALLK